MIRNERNIIKKEVENKEQKGITLVALVITIIILLILAGVTIRGILGEKGLAEEAKNATQRYGQAQDEEQNVVKNFLDELKDINSGGDGTGGNPNNPSNPGENTTNPGGNTVEPGNPTEPEIPPETPGESLAAIAQPGDYIRYTVPEKTFTMTTKQTGYENEQTYNTKEYIELWQVLYNDTERGLQIISKNKVNNEYLILHGKVGYNNCIPTLNSFCSNYVNPKYATSGRCVGTNPINPEGTKELYEENFDFLYSQDLIKGDTDYTEDFYRMKDANIWYIQNNKSYFLASRGAGANSSRAGFSVRWVKATGDIDGNTLWSINSTGIASSFGRADNVRPVITLKTGIKTNSGTGTFSSPYELVE